MKIITKYIEQLQIEQIAVELLSKVVSLILLLIFFTLVKRLLDYLFDKTIIKSIKLYRQSEARQKTIAKLLHNIMNYTL